MAKVSLSEDGSADAMERRRWESARGRMGWRAHGLRRWYADRGVLAWEGAELERIGRSKRG